MKKLITTVKINYQQDKQFVLNQDYQQDKQFVWEVSLRRHTCC